MGVSAGPGPADPLRCPHCGVPVDESAAREHSGIRRLGCLACGVQLVRRPGEGWETIRG